MSNFLNDFNIFLNFIITSIGSIYNWLISTVLGEILLFIVIISIFLFVIYLIINFKN